ncbi:uncharacterized protein LOC129593376 isoform X1 [Paramacrobiotus metropolitanus]|uniref:uncharacterized protein LOC129593376 isoform X1 n=1 Tax=Paramacrobiotus metropolitanus TaxID=2943436 RepID=UPI00244641BD|nr:uncharacterized protein LOC129593376 isoform X1 [Paramacrobiotus metropolitanus]
MQTAVLILLVACSAANALRFARQLPALPIPQLTGGSAGCTAEQKSQCGMAQCQNNNNQNTQVLSGGNSGGGGLISLIPVNLGNGAGVQLPINANVCPPVSVCGICAAGNVAG